MKTAWAIIKETVNEFLEDRAPRLAAATAYYAIFSIGPLLVLIVGVAGLAFGEETVRKEVSRQVQSMLGHQQRAEQGMPRNRQVEEAARRDCPARSPTENPLPKSTDRKDS